jgi:hypothetical protein
MKIIPKGGQEWLRLVLLPFKAYTVIAPILFAISACCPRPPHGPATDAEVLLVVGLIPCAVTLLFTSLVLALVGPKGTALPCAGFGMAAFIIGFLLMPTLAH